MYHIVCVVVYVDYTGNNDSATDIDGKFLRPITDAKKSAEKKLLGCVYISNSNMFII